ncbi:hypothetical protein [Devosia sp.]|uniref:hypothetical protein n=1 Tax=Devosia sp. TaxID=1871048 RepID=UPI001B1C8982|nr:hypothetical protein [Devosia sp.]MBO9588230.1 hypothetical protein [Devosia sp.]
MLKITTLAILAGLVTATSVAPSFAQFAVPGGNQRYPQGSGQQYDCAASMGHMRSVKQADIFAINGNRVALLPVCEDLTVPGKNAYGALFVNGNVNHLRVPIARNATLMAALTAKGYDQNDVVSLRHGANDSIILYVHQRDMN